MRRLIRRIFSRKRKYSGTVIGRDHASVRPYNSKVTLYTIRTGKEGPIIRGSIRGDFKGYDTSMDVGDSVEVTLDTLCHTITSLSTRETVKKECRDGTTRITFRKVEWPSITKYKVLEHKTKEKHRSD